MFMKKIFILNFTQNIYEPPLKSDQKYQDKKKSP